MSYRGNPECHSDHYKDRDSSNFFVEGNEPKIKVGSSDFDRGSGLADV